MTRVYVLALTVVLGATCTTVRAESAPECPLFGSAGAIRLPPCVRVATAASLLEDRPEEMLCDAWSDTEHFRIHFATTGVNMVYGWPFTRYVDSLSVDLERVFARCAGELHWPSVVTDGERGGGFDQIDCYLLDISDQARGMATKEEAGSVECPHAAAGYITVLNTFGTPDFARELAFVAAHEYFHLIQFGAGASGVWFMESSATWAESVIWPRTFDYTWSMPLWFQVPYLTLWNPGSTRLAYGAPHFWIFLQTVTDSAFVPSLLGRLCRDFWMDALKSELAMRGTDLDQVLPRFALWNNATGDWDDGAHYRDGGRYPNITCQKINQVYPVRDDSLPEYKAAREAGSSYIRFLGPGTRDTLHLEYEGDSALAGRRRVCVAAQVHGTPQREWVLTPDAAGRAALSVPGWSALDQVTMIVVNLEGARDRGGVRFSAWEVGAAAPEGIGPLLTYPTPSRGEVHVVWETLTLRGPIQVEIFDVAGRSVSWREVGRLPRGRYRFDWDGRALDGGAVPSGVYFVRVHSGGSERTARFVLVR
jgi:hypothetical protein